MGGPGHRSRAACRAPRSRHRPASDASDRKRSSWWWLPRCTRLGERFSLFHIASFLLVIGLGLDYALFFNRRDGTQAERGRTVYGLVVCSTTTILVFGVLALSQIPVLRAIGLTTALGSLACLVFAAFLAESPKKLPLLATTSPEVSNFAQSVSP